jgi:diguanylate cyclase (GGDEF)-like protein
MRGDLEARLRELLDEQQFQAVSELLERERLHDPLTSLPNRVLLLDRTATALARLRRGSWRVALMHVGIDRLNVLNETLGLKAGDELLRQLGPRLESVLRPGDTVARSTGDGFGILCEGIADEAHAVRIAQRILDAFADPFELAGAKHHVSASVGIAVAGAGHEPDVLIANAETAMWRARERGRGHQELHDAGQRARVTARLRLERDLRDALQTDELWIAYQPIHKAEGGVAAVEALARWTHPVQGNVPPNDFIAIAEDSGLIVALGERILREACEQVTRWGDLSLSVNVSARQVTAPGLVETVGRTLADTGLPPDRLWLELTEGLLLDDSAAVHATLRELSGIGVRLVLDDFGTGYSSLAYLRRFPLEMLKIDRSFIDDEPIVAAIVGMARALGMQTVPEGVETAEQLDRLIALDCDYVQGYHLGRPVAARELEAQLASPR